MIFRVCDLVLLRFEQKRKKFAVSDFFFISAEKVGGKREREKKISQQGAAKAVSSVQPLTKEIQKQSTKHLKVSLKNLMDDS